MKQYLRYAACASTGDLDGMAASLQGFPGADVVGRASVAADPLAVALARKLAATGIHVTHNLGQSTIRCELAIKASGAPGHQTAILTGNLQSFGIAEVVDRHVIQPEILRSAGWDVRFALAKDWLANDGKLVSRMLLPRPS